MTGAAGVAAAGTVSTTTIAREAAFVRYTLVDNPGTIPTDFPREVVDFFTDGVAYNKFNSITPPVGDPRGQLIFQLTSTPVITQSGFVNAAGVLLNTEVPDMVYSKWRFNNWSSYCCRDCWSYQR